MERLNGELLSIFYPVLQVEFQGKPILQVELPRGILRCGGSGDCIGEGTLGHSNFLHFALMTSIAVPQGTMPGPQSEAMSSGETEPAKRHIFERSDL